MIARKLPNKIQCSECLRWVTENDDTLFMRVYSQHKFQNVAAFCSPACKTKFHNKIFQAVNNTQEVAV